MTLAQKDQALDLEQRTEIQPQRFFTLIGNGLVLLTVLSGAIGLVLAHTPPI